MGHRKVKVIGIDRGRLNEEKLIDILLKVEDAVRKYLDENLPKYIDYNVLIHVEEDDALNIVVDIDITYSDSAMLNKVKSIVEDAVSLARRVWEEELMKLKKCFESF